MVLPGLFWTVCFALELGFDDLKVFLNTDLCPKQQPRILEVTIC